MSEPDLGQHLQTMSAKWDELLANEDGLTALQRYEAVRRFNAEMNSHPVFALIKQQRQLRSRYVLGNRRFWKI